MKLFQKRGKFSIFMVMTIFITMSAQAATLGDANNDGSINIIDALVAAQHYVGLNPAIDLVAGNTNCDSRIDIVDSLLIAQYYVGLINQFPCPVLPTPTPPVQGYLHTQGQRIVNGAGENFIMRAMGFGGWMVQEPYMMQISGSAPAGQHSIFADVEELIGRENLSTYHQAWLTNYCQEADVAELKASGFNAIRVAMHYNIFTLPIEAEPVQGQDTWLQPGFDLLDTLLQWCSNQAVYLVLDLHAAPGGQGRDANICDYDSNKPSLWESEENKRKTVALWGKLAERYAREPWIGGYDLINEPNWSFEGRAPNGCEDQVNAPLKELQERILAEIRKVDRNHIVFIEGNCWGTNHNGLWPINDNNIVLSFHKYWNSNDVASIQKYLDLREQYNVPIWDGESGEESNQWYKDAVTLLEDNNIGWAWWTWKKMKAGKGDGPFTIPEPSGYQTLKNYWSYGGQKPDANFAFNIMMELANNARIENCIRNSEVFNSLIQTAK